MSTLQEKTKLTLWLGRDDINFGKIQARRHNKSLSEMFQEFIQGLRYGVKEPVKLTARVKRLKGVLKGKTTGKDEYYADMEKKYLKHG